MEDNIKQYTKFYRERSVSFSHRLSDKKYLGLYICVYLTQVRVCVCTQSLRSGPPS